jgi:transketolase
MRNAFVSELTEIARENEKIVLLVGDIGFGVFENFKKEFPKRYFNLGIAEQNSVGVVSGLAKEGFFPIFYTIIPFLLYRPFEQIRNDLCINRRDALLVGVGAGLSYGALGPTHHALEDISVMSTLPEMRIYAPSSPAMVGKSLDEAINGGSGPAYLRLGKNGESNLIMDSLTYKSWTPIRAMNPLCKIIILTHGSISKTVEEVVQELSLINKLTFCVLEQIKPFPIAEVLKIINLDSVIITIEEHYGLGGIYTHLLASLNNEPFLGKIVGISAPFKFVTEVGSSNDLLESVHLNKESLKSQILGIVDRAQGI